MQKKKNGFLLFCFSFIPGAGEMYMGFMKMGLSLMGAFFASIFLVSITNTPELAVIIALIYIYSFFHAHNIHGLDDERFNAVEDEFLFGIDRLDGVKEFFTGKNKKWIAIFVIILGAIMTWNACLEILWDYFGKDNFLVKALYSVSDYLPSLLIGVAIIFAGVKLIVGKKDEENSVEPSLIEDKSEEQ